MTQLALTLAVPTAPTATSSRRTRRLVPQPRPSIEQRFDRFHRENPIVYETLARLARQAKAAGKTRVGAKALWERLRWELDIETRGGLGEFRLDNSLVALYARKLMQEPGLDGIFETRERKAR